MGLLKRKDQKGVAPVQAQYTGGSSQTTQHGCLPVGLPQLLQMEEKRFLMAVERGDIPNVRRILQKAHRKRHININCMDPLGRRALTLAIDNENLEMVELLVIMGVETKDALLHAINAEFVEAVELLLEHEELIYKEGDLYDFVQVDDDISIHGVHTVAELLVLDNNEEENKKINPLIPVTLSESWQKLDLNTAMFPPDITPIILAAHKNNFEILKILLDRGAAVPVPHDIRCGCEECVRMCSEDSLRHSLSRVNIYRALASPSLICLTSHDPVLTAFQLSWEMRNLAFTEQECKQEYMDLRSQCQQFAVDLLDQTRTSHELAIILNYDPEMSSYQPGDRMTLNRLTQAIYYKQKKFVAHSNIQQLLSSIWYEGLPGFRRKTFMEKLLCIAKVAILFPMYCMIYMFAPNCKTGMLMRKPFMKFLIHASSYLFFLFILILVSQRADDNVIRLLGTDHMRQELAQEQLRQRGQGPTKLELLVVFYLVGFMWEEIQEIFTVGMKCYLRNMWNFIDFLRNSLYISVICLRIFAYIQQAREISRDPKMAFVPREHWHDFDPQLIAEGLFAAANVFSALKLVHMFSINPHLGPLQISLGRMVIDIVKFFFIYSLVLFAFACGLNQLLWYFADLEKSKCYILPGGEADWAGHSDSCMKWRRFGNLFESSQSLFWASFGMVGLDDFELTGIKSYTRFWGLLMFGSYSVINVIVLLNLLIAMMSNSYAMIDLHSDTEWKFARTKLWMSYFDDSATLPPPFNVMPSVKWLIRVFRKSSKEIDRKRSKKRQAKEQENAYDNIMRSLVWRYVAAQHRKFEDNPVTEDDINEVKSEISTMRYEMLEIFENSGMDVSSAAKKEKPCRAKKTKIWERRLMRGFQVAPIDNPNDEKSRNNGHGNVNGYGDMNEIIVEKEPSKPEKETPKERFRRVAHMVAAQSTAHKWTVVLQGTIKNSQIGRSNKDTSKNLEQLGKAIEEAKKLILKGPSSISGRESPIGVEFEDEKTDTLLELLNQITEELNDTTSVAPCRQTKLQEVKHKFLQHQHLPMTTEKKLIIKDTSGSAKPKSKTVTTIEPTNSLTARSQTLPEIQVAKKTAHPKQNTPSSSINKKINELTLSAGSLNRSNTAKKAAPQIPGSGKAQHHTHKPFSVEMGRVGRKKGYGGQPLIPDGNIDLNIVDVDEDESSMMDDISQFSFDVTHSSQGPYTKDNH